MLSDFNVQMSFVTLHTLWHTIYAIVMTYTQKVEIDICHRQYINYNKIQVQWLEHFYSWLADNSSAKYFMFVCKKIRNKNSTFTAMFW